MLKEPKTVEVEAGTELDLLLAEAAAQPLRLVRDGVRFRLAAEDEDPWAGYDPGLARAGMRAAAGAWRDIDTEAMKAYIYRAREEGTRPPDRP